MIKSKTNTFGFWFSIVMTLFSICIGVSQFFQESGNQSKIIVLIVGVFLTLLFGSQLWRNSKHILIDTIRKTIIFTNFFTKQKTVYSFSDIEGYVDLYQPARGGSYRVLYLVKGGKFVEIVSTFIYSNVYEIEKALQPIKYLGLKDFSYLNSIRILLKLKVLND